MRIRSLIIAVLALAACAAPALGHSAPTTVGLAGVQSAALQQNARSLDWTVTFVHGISPRGARVLPPARLPRARDAPRARRRGDRLPERVRARPAARTHTDLMARSRGRRDPPARRRRHPQQPGPDDHRELHPDRARPPLSLRALAGAQRSPRPALPQHAARTGRSCRLCAVDFPARHAPLAAMHTPQLVGCVPAGPSLVYHGPTDQREIALSFDDGPWSRSPDDRLRQRAQAARRHRHVLRDRRADQRVRPDRSGRAGDARRRGHDRQPHLDASGHDRRSRPPSRRPSSSRPMRRSTARPGSPRACGGHRTAAPARRSSRSRAASG